MNKAIKIIEERIKELEKKDKELWEKLNGQNDRETVDDIVSNTHAINELHNIKMKLLRIQYGE